MRYVPEFYPLKAIGDERRGRVAHLSSRDDGIVVLYVSAEAG